MEHMDKVFVSHGDTLGNLWAIGWLFTIGYLSLPFKKGFLAIFIWPYYIGKKFAHHHSA